MITLKDINDAVKSAHGSNSLQYDALINDAHRAYGLMPWSDNALDGDISDTWVMS